MHKILLVDDDPQGLQSTRKILELAQYEVVTATDGQEALDLVRKAPDAFSLVLTDVRMPRLGGLEFLRALALLDRGTPVILMTAFGRVEDAVWAMKLGAVDFLTKPFKRQALLSSVEKALKRSSRANREDVAPGLQLLGNSAMMQKLRAEISQVAATSASVLIQGESGTGKELVARAIHSESARRAKPLVAINCAAVPETLMESELFGHERGAFTGASAAKVGLFEAADQGTLLLDEIGDLPLALQPKLLRVLQESEVRRLGSTVSHKINVRVLAATHRNLRELCREGKFREDLLFRLEVISLPVPALRDRLEDLEELARSFLVRSASLHQKLVAQISPEALVKMSAHTWPGNVRELANVIERGVVFGNGDTFEVGDLPPHLVELAARSSEASFSIKIGTPLKEVEELLIRKTLEATDGDKNMTAKLLGINSRTIYRKLQNP